MNKHAAKIHDLASSGRAIPWWILLAVVPLWADHLGFLEVHEITEHPQDLVGLVGVLGAAYAAFKGSTHQRADDGAKRDA